MTKFMAVLFAMALVPARVYAVDGQILINQATVNAAGGFPYKITQPGSYKLSGNLALPGGSPADGIDINADNVTLDLGGFTITGGGVFAGAGGISNLASASSRITVVNGVVTGFSFGVSLVGSGNLLRDVQAGGNQQGFDVTGGSIVHCTANDNVASGMGVSDSIVSDSIANQNGGLGIVALASSLIGNVVTSNRSIGIFAQQQTLVGNNVMRNNQQDLRLDATAISQHSNSCSSGSC